MFKNKRVLVTGASGSVGSQIVQRLIGQQAIVCAFDNDENGLFHLQREHKNKGSFFRAFLGDLREVDRLQMACHGVNYVFHCAALKHVGISEYNPFEAVKTNVVGCQNVIQASLDNNVEKVIFTSSDKAVNPTGTMGATKLIGEKLFIAANNYAGSKRTKFSSVRFGNVLNTNGSVLKIFEKRITQGLDIEITDRKMTRFFISMKAAVDLCLMAAEKSLGGEIFIKDMGSCDIYTLARAFLKNESADFKEIGSLPGEKLYEELFSDTEALRTVKVDNTYVIMPEIMIDNKLEMLTKTYGSNFLLGALRSDNNILKYSEVLDMLSKDAQDSQ